MKELDVPRTTELTAGQISFLCQKLDPGEELLIIGFERRKKIPSLMLVPTFIILLFFCAAQMWWMVGFILIFCVYLLVWFLTLKQQSRWYGLTSRRWIQIDFDSGFLSLAKKSEVKTSVIEGDLWLVELSPADSSARPVNTMIQAIRTPKIVGLGH